MIILPLLPPPPPLPPLRAYYYQTTTSSTTNRRPDSCQFNRRPKPTGSGPSERGEHRPIEWGRCVCRGIVFYPEGSAVWRQCWLCAVCAVGRVGCCVGGGRYPMGVSISSSNGPNSPTARVNPLMNLPLYPCSWANPIPPPAVFSGSPSPHPRCIPGLAP